MRNQHQSNGFYRMRTGPGKPGKSWKNNKSKSRPGKPEKSLSVLESFGNSGYFMDICFFLNI